MNQKLIASGVELVLDGITDKNWRTDPNFKETPERVARAFAEILSGMENSKEQIDQVLAKSFPTHYGNMIFSSGIETISMCPHHLLIVKYKITIAYIPVKGIEVIGASKLARIAEILSARPVLQEQLTYDIDTILSKKIQPLGIAVIVSGQHQCYDKDTEVLTDAGWKLFKNLGPYDKVAQVDQESMELSFARPSNHISYKYQGEMIQIKTKGYDLLITPNHRVLCESEWKFYTYKKFSKVVLAEELDKENHRLCLPKAPTSGKLDGQRIGSIYGISGDHFCEFMGWYIADGSCNYRNGRKSVCITKSKARGDERDYLIAFLKRANISFRTYENEKNIAIKGDFLQKVFPLLYELGKSRDKFVPRIIKQTTQHQIYLFLEAYERCDGHTYENARVHFASESTQLISDIQELLLYVGLCGTVQYTEKRMETRNPYVLVTKDKISKVPYSGKVYCVTVPTGFLLVRRNGCTAISGNCMQVRGVKQSSATFETSSMSGVFRSQPETRAEFFSLLNNSKKDLL